MVYPVLCWKLIGTFLPFLELSQRYSLRDFKLNLPRWFFVQGNENPSMVSHVEHVFADMRTWFPHMKAVTLHERHWREIWCSCSSPISGPAVFIRTIDTVRASRKMLTNCFFAIVHAVRGFCYPGFDRIHLPGKNGSQAGRRDGKGTGTQLCIPYMKVNI